MAAQGPTIWFWVGAGAADANVTPTTVAAQAFVDTPSVTADANVTLTTVVAQVSIDTPAVTADANVTPTTVAAQAFVDTPIVATIRVIHLATAVHRERNVRGPQLTKRSTVIQGRTGTVSADANVTPDTVVAQASIDTPTVQGDADVTPTTVAATTAVDTPTVTGDANVTTTTVVAQAFVDIPVVTGDADVTPTTVVAQASVDTPTVTGDANVTAGDVVATAFVDTPTVEASGDVSITTNDIAAVVTIDGVTVTTTRNVKVISRSDRKRIAQGPQTELRSWIKQGYVSTISADASVTPDTVVATAFIDTPSVTTGRAKVLAAPDRRLKVRGPRRQQRSSVVQGFELVVAVDADVTAGDVAATVSIPTPSVEAGRVLGQTIAAVQPAAPPLRARLRARIMRGRVPVSASVTPDTVIAQVSIDTPAVTGDADVTPDTVVAQAFVDIPGITASGDADITAGAVPTEAFIPTPGVTGDANVTLTTVAAVVSVPTPSVAADADITPTTVIGQATVPTPTVTAAAPGDADVNLETVVARVNMDAFPLVEPGVLSRHRGLIGYGFGGRSPHGQRRP